jgi:predicted RNase H-like HicB family nuclease
MLTEYIKAAMSKAEIEYWPEDKMYFGRIPQCQGVLATGETKEACIRELEEVLEGWLLLGIYHHDPIPEIDGISLDIKEAA